MTAYAKDKITKENIEVPTYADYIAHRVDTSGGAPGGEIQLGTNGGHISLLHDVPTQGSIPAGTIQDLYILGLTRPAGWNANKAMVFAQKTSGQSSCHIDAAGFHYDGSNWSVYVRLKNETNSNVTDYDGTTNIMIVDWN